MCSRAVMYRVKRGHHELHEMNFIGVKVQYEYQATENQGSFASPVLETLPIEDSALQ